MKGREGVSLVGTLLKRVVQVFPNGLDGRHRGQRPADDLRRAGLAVVVNCFSLKQFGVSQDNAQLVVQLVQQLREAELRL